APPGSFYEVWLLNAQTGGMVAVGVLPTGSTGRFALPTAVVSHYDAVDISLQPDNGSTAHSSNGLLQARSST
ncbi:MAG TPA: anti-sigma factor, partial [Acidimicrobiales bacterium]|nr:anti-sigma factor [Acidimicrobiales bacterium]